MNPRHSTVPAARVRAVSQRPLQIGADYVLYWMIGSRRLDWSWALQRAVDWCRSLGKPLVILEALRVDHPWASKRFHRFVLDGMAEHAADCAARGITYHAWIEPTPGDGRGLLEALAERASLVVTDDVPWSFLPKMVTAAGRRLPVRLEAVDGLGWLPFREAAGTEFKTAHALRRHLQRALPALLDVRPAADPLVDPVLRGAVIPAKILERWPMASDALLRGEGLGALPIDHAVRPVALRGGGRAARARLERFLTTGLERYEERSHPDESVSSGLSAHLHWGHLSAQEVVAAVLDHEGWTPEKLGAERSGSREGFWGVSAAAAGFLDQIVTWRELGANLGATRGDEVSRASILPSWAYASLDAHRADPRPKLMSVAELERAETPDNVWNAAQRELMATGVIHNSVRMVWGKRVLEWTRGPEEALDTLIRLNDRWALDGRDGNSYTGITWVLGRYDRAWGPERPIFGLIRYMSSENSLKKWRMKQYMARWSGVPQPPARARP